jgi:hypothetical protein
MRNRMIRDDRGNKFWYQNDLLHRTDGPAIEFASGAKSWYHNGLRHRTDGPAIERADGDKYWYIKGVDYTFNNWLELVNTTEVQKTLMRLQYA